MIPELSPSSETPIWSKCAFESAIESGKFPTWVATSYSAFIQTISDKGFPCYFAATAHRKDAIRYVVATSLKEEEVLRHVLEAIYAFLEEERQWTALCQATDEFLLTLAILCPWSQEEQSQAFYAQEAFALLNRLHHLDDTAWDPRIPTDPTDVKWRYCIGGRSLFVNVSTPANKARRSRCLGPGTVIMINTDDIFDRLWLQSGEAPRHSIYRRMEAFDQVEPYPGLHCREKEHSRALYSAKLTVIDDHNDVEHIFPFKYKNCAKQNRRAPPTVQDNSY